MRACPSDPDLSFLNVPCDRQCIFKMRKPHLEVTDPKRRNRYEGSLLDKVKGLERK